MNNREKIISAIEKAKKQSEEYAQDRIIVPFKEADMILDLLKEQEPVKPTYEDYFGNRVARCGNCNGYIVRYRYCPGCGKQVKWE